MLLLLLFYFMFTISHFLNILISLGCALESTKLLSALNCRKIIRKLKIKQYIKENSIQVLQKSSNTYFKSKWSTIICKHHLYDLELLRIKWGSASIKRSPESLDRTWAAWIFAQQNLPTGTLQCRRWWLQLSVDSIMALIGNYNHWSSFRVDQFISPQRSFIS